MKTLKAISEEEMVLEFLRAEFTSPRFLGRYREWLSRRGIQVDVSPETIDPALRKELLWSVRPGLFKTLPENIVWQDVLLEDSDWAKIMYLNEDDWKNFSSGTRLVQRGVDKLGQPEHTTLNQRVSEISAGLQSGEEFPKIILVATLDLTKLVLLEGHVRATAFVASGAYTMRKISAILGMSEQIAEWGWY